MLRALLPLLAVALCAAEPANPAATPAPRSEPEAVERHQEILKDPARAAAQVLFLGDSITQQWTDPEAGGPVWDKVWAPLKAANLGVAGDRTEHVLWRIGHGCLDGTRARAVVLLIGTNNAGMVAESKGAYRCTPEQTAAGVAAILEQVKTRCPQARILLMGILPRTEAEDPANLQNLATNPLLKRLADGKRVVWMDIGAKFVNPQNNDATLKWMPDLLHLNTDAYRVWAEAIRPQIAAWLAAPGR